MNHVVQIGLYATLIVAVVLSLVIGALRSGRKGAKGEAVRDIGLLVGFLVLLYAAFPWAFSFIVYQGIVLHSFGAIPAVIGIFMAVNGLKLVTGEPSLMAAFASIKNLVEEKDGGSTRVRRRPQSDRLSTDASGEPVMPLQSNGVLYILMGVLFVLVGPELVLTLNHSHLAKVYTFEKRSDMVVMSKTVPRFTPQEVAFAKLRASLSSSEYRVDLEHTQPCDVDGGFGYVATLMPQGMMNIFYGHVPGFLVYDDHPELPEEKRIRRIDQSFKYGMGMQWTDSIYRRLARHNPFCTYGEPYPLQLSEDKNVFTLVVPKISYHFDFPCFWVPYQSGIVLVSGDGTLKEMSMDEVRKDPVFNKKRLMCVDLVRLMTEKQIYDEGYLRGWYTRPGLIKIPAMPGNARQPFLLTDEDHKEYYVTLTEPVGNQALMRVYYVDATTGDRTRFDCDPNAPIPGPEVSVQAVKALQGYKWIEHDAKDQDGNFHIVEPRLMSPEGEMSYLFSVATKNYFEIALTCVVEPRSNQLHSFSSRRAFERWMRGEKVPEGQQSTLNVQDIDDALRLLNEALKKVEALKP